MATGLRRDEFEGLEFAEVEVLLREVAERERRAMVPWCDLFALLCNLLAGGKRTWKREDFMPVEGRDDVKPAEVEAGIRAYQEAVAARREKCRKANAERPRPNAEF